MKLKCKLPKGGLRTSQKQKVKKNITQNGGRTLKENQDFSLGMTETESLAATQTAWKWVKEKRRHMQLNPRNQKAKQ